MLRLDGVRAGYGRTMVLDGVDLEIKRGELVALLGRNGAGKTTTLRTVMGYIPTADGTVHFDGKDLRGLETHERARAGIAYVPQGREIFPSLSVGENLRLAAHGARRSDWRDAVEEMYKEFPVLGEKRKQAGGQLSGGQQQILALARALVTQPQVLLLDEPSEGIQPSIVDQIAEVVGDLSRRRGLTVVLVEQNLDFAVSLASRACIMDKGRIVAERPAKEVLADRELQLEYLGV